MEVGVEQERLQHEAELDVKINEEEVTTQTPILEMLLVKAREQSTLS